MRIDPSFPKTTFRPTPLLSAAAKRIAQVDTFTPAVRSVPTLPGIDQRKPDGAGTPTDYLGATNCGPTTVAMVLRGLGAEGLAAGNTDLVRVLATELGTNGNGTAASELPRVFLAHGFQTEQLARNSGTFARSFNDLPASEQEAALSRVLGPTEARRLMGELSGQRMNRDAVRLIGLRAETEQFVARHVEAGHPVLLNVSFAVLHPEATSGTGHFIAVTGVTHGADGRVDSYTFMDPWTGQPATVSADTMALAISGNSTCLPTAVIP